MQTGTHKIGVSGRGRPGSLVSKPNKIPHRNSIVDLRARVEAQVIEWDEELRDLHDRVSAIEVEANARIAALMNASPAHEHCELAEAQASAYRADAIARHIYEHQLVTLRSAIATQMSAWQNELGALHIPPEHFWEDVLHGDMKATWLRLNRINEGSTEAWHGFSMSVEQMLSGNNG